MCKLVVNKTKLPRVVCLALSICLFINPTVSWTFKQEPTGLSLILLCTGYIHLDKCSFEKWAEVTSLEEIMSPIMRKTSLHNPGSTFQQFLNLCK